MSFAVQSSAFGSGAEIPKKFTCEGPDVSPALEWSGVPQGTATFALIADDPDAPVGTWVHWVIWNMSPDTHGLPEAVPRSAQLDTGAQQGDNDFRKIGYDGPCPPAGKAHRYFFRLYALDRKLDLPAGSRRKDLDSAMKGHVLAQAEYMGTFRR
jgi:Raf kinase inhibitor-like YbhB/YbcL family protein